MKLKAIIDGNGDLCLATEGGELIEDTQIKQVESRPGEPLIVAFMVTVSLDSSTTIIEADELAARALPVAQPYIELSPEQVQDNLERLRPRPFLEDDDTDEGGPVFRDDEEEWEDDEECHDCGGDFCPRCGLCMTPACEAEQCDCPPY